MHFLYTCKTYQRLEQDAGNQRLVQDASKFCILHIHAKLTSVLFLHAYQRLDQDTDNFILFLQKLTSVNSAHAGKFCVIHAGKFIFFFNKNLSVCALFMLVSFLITKKFKQK